MKSTLAAIGLAFALSAPIGAASAEDDTWVPIDPDNTLYVELQDGTVVIALMPDVAPGHVARLKDLAREGFYNDVVFHRVIDGFMAQGGDPTGTGTGGSQKPDLTAEFTFHASLEGVGIDERKNTVSIMGPAAVITEPESMQFVRPDGKVQSWMPHCPGITSMARSSNPNSANSQFFWMFAKYPSLDRQYTSWGKIIYGEDLLNGINRGEPPANPDKIVRMRVGSDIPEAERFAFEVMAPGSITLSENIEAATENGLIDVCKIDIPVRRVSAD